MLRGSRTIDRQASDLNNRVAELTGLLAQNRALHRRVQRATQEATALNESYLRRLGADLHDGPAQFVALAAMRLDSELVLAADADPKRREDEIRSIRGRLAEALDEIRAICRGIRPDLMLIDLSMPGNGLNLVSGDLLALDIGSASASTRTAMADLVAENVIAWFQDGAAITPVP